MTSIVLRILRTPVACLPLLLVMAGTPALAQSFDCAKARAPHELLICASPTMRSLDRELGAAYSAALARLSESAHIDVRRAQREWLAYWPTSCRDGRAPLNPRSRKAQECAAQAYRERLTTLRSDSIIGGDLRIYSYNRYLIGRSTDPQVSGFYSYANLDWLLVDIDGAPPYRRAMAVGIDRWLREDVPANFTLETNLGYNDEKLSLQPSLPFLLTACRTAMVGTGGLPSGFTQKFRHFHLVAGRPMILSDIFASSGWQQPLGSWIERAVRNESGEDLSEETRTELQSAAIDPARWTFGRDGLTVNAFNRFGYDLLGAGDSKFTVPWSVLSPWLTESVRRVVVP